MNKKINKLSRMINEAIRYCLYKGKGIDLRLSICPITITRVELSQDKSLIKCFFIGFNTEIRAEDLLAILNSAKKPIRYYLTQKLQFKYSPDIRFYYDNGFFNLEDIERALAT